ncbi:L domain-like protein [Anaeromyces robustus]|uniref:L domain-like protein n=1 Tax=Anaeromyces robustus TaxID=1754192 RepID=A0A1Y1X4F6_9FUNG|nr:L domain-like protein [Anaeromyces robustus]|eukprot:ORX80697.1 L domain-like protein [Anaeromyces robustus]
MKLKNLLKGITLILFSNSFAFAKDKKVELKGNCKDIKTYLEEKKIDYEESISECEVNRKGKLISINFDNYNLNEDDIKKILSYETIESLSYTVYEGNIDFTPSYIKFPSEIFNLKNLKELYLKYVGFREYQRYSLSMNYFKQSETIKKLTLVGFEINLNSIDQISNLIGLEELILDDDTYKSSTIFDPLKFLPHLQALTIHGSSYLELEEFPVTIYNMTNLKKLSITRHRIQTLSNDLVKLKNLEYLDLSDNEIEFEIPESFNELKELKYIDLRRNKNFKGKTLTISNLEKCYYDNNYSLCRAKKMKCFEKNITFESCTDEDNKINPHNECGKGKGKCAEGLCCSKYGYCGSSENHCLISKGCQSGYGFCKSNTISTNGRCGRDYGICPNGKCCSKYGYCGNSEKYCSTDNGCQLDYGICSPSNIPISTNGKCGVSDGKCPFDKCCSKYGQCGTSDKHCLIDKGCQTKYGLCTTLTISKNGRCGPDYGRCSSNYCCSKYGWCGKSEEYCGIGCQSTFGKCN